MPEGTCWSLVIPVLLSGSPEGAGVGSLHHPIPYGRAHLIVIRVTNLLGACNIRLGPCLAGRSEPPLPA